MEGGMARQAALGLNIQQSQDRLHRLLLSLPGVWKRGGTIRASGGSAEGVRIRSDLGPSLATKFMRERK